MTARSTGRRAAVLSFLAALSVLATLAAALAAPASAARPYSDRTQTMENGAGVIFHPRGDRFQIWDNERDGHRVVVWYHYAGVKDRWKRVPTIADGGTATVRHDLKEGRVILFTIRTWYDEAPIVRYGTS